MDKIPIKKATPEKVRVQPPCANILSSMVSALYEQLAVILSIFDLNFSKMISAESHRQYKRQHLPFLTHLHQTPFKWLFSDQVWQSHT